MLAGARGVCFGESKASLTHFWDFTTGSLNDRVGASNATRNGTAAFVSGGLRCYGGSSNAASYVNLSPSGANILPAGDFAVAVACRVMGSSNWQRMFDFGTGTAAYLMMAQRTTYSNHMRWEIRAANRAYTRDVDYAISSGVDRLYAAVVYRNNGALKVQYSSFNSSGTLLKQADTDVTGTSAIPSYTNFWLGRSQFSADYAANTLFKKCGIYSGKLTRTDLANECRSVFFR